MRLRHETHKTAPAAPLGALAAAQAVRDIAEEVERMPSADLARLNAARPWDGWGEIKASRSLSATGAHGTWRPLEEGRLRLEGIASRSGPPSPARDVTLKRRAALAGFYGLLTLSAASMLQTHGLLPALLTLGVIAAAGALSFGLGGVLARRERPESAAVIVLADDDARARRAEDALARGFHADAEDVAALARRDPLRVAAFEEWARAELRSLTWRSGKTAGEAPVFILDRKDARAAHAVEGDRSVTLGLEFAFLPRTEARGVMAHELGHLHHHDGASRLRFLRHDLDSLLMGGMLISSVALLSVFFKILLYFLAPEILVSAPEWLISRTLSLPWWGIAAGVAGLIVGTAASRLEETRADDFSKALAGSAAADFLLRGSADKPSAWRDFLLRWSHPHSRERVKRLRGS